MGTIRTNYQDTENVRKRPSRLGEDEVDDFIGAVIALDYPDSGTLGQVMCRVDNIEFFEEDNKRIVRVESHNILTGAEKVSYAGKFPPTISYPAEGATYWVYTCEHLKGNGKWVRTTPWVDSQHSATSYYQDYEGHETRRIRYKKAEYLGLEDVVREEVVEISEGTMRERVTDIDSQ